MTIATRLLQNLNRMPIDTIAYKSMKELVGKYKKSLASRGNVWSGRLLRDMRPIRRGKQNWGITPLYAYALDHQRPHWTSLKRGRKMRRWWREKVLEGNAPQKYPSGAFVKPHPFMKRFEAGHIHTFNKYVLPEVHKAIRRSM